MVPDMVASMMDDSTPPGVFLVSFQLARLTDESVGL